MHLRRRVVLLVSCLLVFAGATAIPASRGDEPVPAAPQKIVVELKVVEVYTTKLRNLGFDWAQIKPDGTKHDAAEAIAPVFQGHKIVPDQFNGFLEALRQNNLARVLAEPTLVTLDGRPASFEVAGHTGHTKLDVLPIVLGNGHVKLEYRIDVAVPQAESNRLATKRDANQPAPPLVLDAATELEMGKTVVVGHARKNSPTADGKANETETLVLVRVDTIKTGSLR